MSPRPRPPLPLTTPLRSPAAAAAAAILIPPRTEVRSSTTKRGFPVSFGGVSHPPFLGGTEHPFVKAGGRLLFF